MIHETSVVGSLQCNCVLLACERTKEAVLIDPGDNPEKILAMVKNAGVTVKYLLHTHAHFDHIGATKAIHEALKAAPCLHADDDMIYKNLPMQGQLFGFHFEEAPAIEKYLQDEEEIIFGDCKLSVIHTPGHSPGSICFESKDQGKVFSGDTLFRQSVGRADLWGGNADQLIKSIKTKLLTLDGDMKVFPGHGPSSLIGVEKRSNPFLQ